MEIEEAVEKACNFLSQLLSMLLTIALLGDLLGINVAQLFATAVTRPWKIPYEVLVQYYPLWYGMAWALFIVMLFDQVYTMRYMQVHNRPPPPNYERWVSLATFLLSFWLMLVMRYLSLMLICIFSAISFAYTMFVAGGEGA